MLNRLASVKAGFRVQIAMWVSELFKKNIYIKLKSVKAYLKKL